MAVPPTQINYPLTTFSFSDPTNTAVNAVAPTSVTLSNISGGITYTARLSPQNLSIVQVEAYNIKDITSSTGTPNQILSGGDNGGIIWKDIITPSLAEVMAVSPAGDASGQALTNIPSITMNTGSNTSSVVLSAISSSDVLSISTNPDITGSTKEFSRKYLPLRIAGTTYYIQLFSVPA